MVRLLGTPEVRAAWVAMLGTLLGVWLGGETSRLTVESEDQRAFQGFLHEQRAEACTQLAGDIQPLLHAHGDLQRVLESKTADPAVIAGAELQQLDPARNAIEDSSPKVEGAAASVEMVGSNRASDIARDLRTHVSHVREYAQLNSLNDLSRKFVIAEVTGTEDTYFNLAGQCRLDVDATRPGPLA